KAERHITAANVEVRSAIVMFNFRWDDELDNTACNARERTKPSVQMEHQGRKLLRSVATPDDNHRPASRTEIIRRADPSASAVNVGSREHRRSGNRPAVR